MSFGHTIRSSHFNQINEISNSALCNGFTRIWNQIKIVQMRRAEHIFLDTLQTMNDQTLQQYGYTPADITKLKSGIFTNPSQND